MIVHSGNVEDVIIGLRYAREKGNLTVDRINAEMKSERRYKNRKTVIRALERETRRLQRKSNNQ